MITPGGAAGGGDAGREPFPLVAALVVCAVVAVLAVVLVWRWVGVAPVRSQGIVPGEVRDGGGRLLAARIVGSEERRALGPVPAGRLCATAAAAAVPGSGELVDCQSVPLVVPARVACEQRVPVSTAAVTGPPRCPPLDPAVAERVLGWTVHGPSPGVPGSQWVVSVFAGDTDPQRAGGAPLWWVLTSSAPAARWAELAVCPADVDGDGYTELLVLTRATAVGGRRGGAEIADIPEVVVVDLDAPGGGPDLGPVMVAFVPDEDVPRADGEGCRSPAVHRLRIHDGEVLVVGEPTGD
jgi:hypothetical protein